MPEPATFEEQLLDALMVEAAGSCESYASSGRERKISYRRRFMVLWTAGLVEQGREGAALVEKASDHLRLLEPVILGRSAHRRAYEAAQQRWEAAFGKHVEEREAPDA